MLELITAKTEARAEGTVTATLDDLARVGAQRMIAAALQIEVDDYLARFREERDAAGHARVVRNGTARACQRPPHIEPPGSGKLSHPGSPIVSQAGSPILSHPGSAIWSHSVKRDRIPSSFSPSPEILAGAHQLQEVTSGGTEESGDRHP